MPNNAAKNLAQFIVFSKIQKLENRPFGHFLESHRKNVTNKVVARIYNCVRNMNL